jgi:predicted Rossmann fold flavoprotein
MKNYYATNVVVATGAISFSQVGVSGLGLEIAQKFGHKTSSFLPALCGLTLQKEQFWMKELSGISTEVKIEIESRIVVEDLLFAHKGISGPAVLSASLYWNKGIMIINFLPNSDLETLLLSSKKMLSTLLPLPKRFTQEFLKSINIEDKAIPKYTTQELAKIKRLQSYTFSPAGHFGLTKAEVCKGGIDCKAIDAKSMMSKKVDNLYFTGEVLDITGELGGYNFQWAFSSGFVAGSSIYSKSL